MNPPPNPSPSPAPPYPPAPAPAAVARFGRLRWPAIQLLLVISGLPELLAARWRQVRQDGDAGSITVEKAIIAAIAIGLAIGLMAAIAAVVAKYQARIQ